MVSLVVYLSPATKLGQGNIFRSVCQEFYPQGGGHAWQGGRVWQGGMHGRGACVAGGCAWQGACVVGEQLCHKPAGLLRKLLSVK